MSTTPDYAGLIGLLNALAVDHECDEEHDAKETCDKSAETIRTLLERNAALERERDELKHDVSRYVEIASEEATRAEAATARLAKALKTLNAIIKRNNNDPLGTPKVNDIRRIATEAARRALKGEREE